MLSGRSGASERGDSWWCCPYRDPAGRAQRPPLGRGSLCRFAGRTRGAGCGGLARDHGQQGWCSDCCLAQNRAGDPRPDPGRGPLAQIRGQGPSPRYGAGDPHPEPGRGPSSRTEAGDPPPDPGWGPSSRSRPGTCPWAAGPSCQEDPRPDPASLSAQRAGSQG